MLVIMNIIEETLSACISTAKSEPIQTLQKDRYVSFHSQLHGMLLMPSGSLKSTILGNINPKAYVKIHDYTYPSLLGSIGKTGNIIPGYVMQAAGKCLICDEFHSLDWKSRKALLSLTEDQQAIRVLGYSAANPTKTRNRYLICFTKANEIHYSFVRCTFLMSGIFAPHKRREASVDDRAFSSRFVPISLKPTLEDLDDIAIGKTIPLNIKWKPSPGGQKMDDWTKFVRSYRKCVDGMNPKIKTFFHENPEFYVRGRLHMLRLFSFSSNSNSIIADWEKYLSQIPFFLYSAVESTLSFSEYNIYTQLKNGMKAKEISEANSISEAYVSQTIKTLKTLGLWDSENPQTLPKTEFDGTY